MTRHAYAHDRRGFFAIGIWHPKTDANVGSLMRSASLFDAAFVFTVGRRYKRQASDTVNTPKQIPLFHFSDVGELVAHLPHSCPLVGVELDASARPLSGFMHTERAAYLLGAEDHGIAPAVLDRCHFLVQVECPSPESMNVACAGSILMHHRYIQARSLRP